MRDESQAPLAWQVRSALRWSVLNTMFGRIGTLAAGIVLARLLDPRDFGVFAVANVAMLLVLSLNDGGVSAAIVRANDEELPGLAHTGATVILGLSGVLYSLIFLIAPSFCSALHSPDATGVVRLLSVGVLIDAVFAVPSAMLTRSLRQDRRMVCDFTTFAVSTGLTLVLAASGAGAVSLAWGRLAGNLVGGLAILVLTRVLPRPGWNREIAAYLVRFGLPLVGTSLLLFATINVDTIIVGRMLDPVALGIYTLAFNISNWPVGTLSDSIRRVSLVAFAKLHNEGGDAGGAFVRALGLVLLVAVPVCGLLSVLASPLVGFLYPEKWHNAAHALRFLAVLGVCRVAFELISDFLVALGRPKTVFYLQGLWVACLIPAIAIGARVNGITGVGVAHMIVAAGIVMPAAFLTVRRYGVRLRGLGRLVVRPVVAVAIALPVALAGAWLVQGNFLQLLVGGTAAIVLYAAVCYPARSLWRPPRTALAVSEQVVG